MLLLIVAARFSVVTAGNMNSKSRSIVIKRKLWQIKKRGWVAHICYFKKDTIIDCSPDQNICSAAWVHDGICDDGTTSICDLRCHDGEAADCYSKKISKQKKKLVDPCVYSIYCAQNYYFFINTITMGNVKNVKIIKNISNPEKWTEKIYFNDESISIPKHARIKEEFNVLNVKIFGSQKQFLASLNKPQLSTIAKVQCTTCL